MVNLDIYTDLKQAGASDDIERTVNYKTVTKAIIKHIEEVKRYTVEHLATEIAKIAL